MEWFADYAQVIFGGIDKVFEIPSVFCRFTIGSNTVEIKCYAVIIAFGFILAALFGGRIAYTWKMDLSKMVDVLIYGTFAGIIGARAYYVIFRWDYYGKNIGEIFEIWNGGLAIYGGIIGGILAAYLTCRFEKLNFRNLLDLVGMSLLIGQGIGRWGNFANQEAFGGFTNGNYGMMSGKVASYIAGHPASFGMEYSEGLAALVQENKMYVHPTFFYESVCCLVGFLVLYLILKTCRKFSGQLFLCYGIWYGLTRMIIEGMRTDSLYIGSTNLRVSQLLSGAAVVVCATLLVYMLIRVKKHPVPIEGVDFFPEKTPRSVKAEKKTKPGSTEKAPTAAQQQEKETALPEAISTAENREAEGEKTNG